MVWDPGYSLCKPESTSVPLAQAGIVQTFQPVTHQRGSRPFSGEALLIDGQLFSPHLPQELRQLPAPPRARRKPKRSPTRRISTDGHAGDSSVTPALTSMALPGGAVPFAPACSEAVKSQRP